MLKLHGGLAGVDLWWLIALMLLVRGLGLDMIGVARMGSAIRELQIARRELARLAVIEERERLSRDLHDLLGQTLSMITLKSELARHLVTEEPDRCAQGLSEIERVSRKTLREVREAAAGYVTFDFRLPWFVAFVCTDVSKRQSSRLSEYLIPIRNLS